MRDRATKVEESLEWIRYGDEELRSAADLLNAADPVTMRVRSSGFGVAMLVRCSGRAEIEVGTEDAREWMHQSELVRAAVLEKLPADIRDAL